MNINMMMMIHNNMMLRKILINLMTTKILSKNLNKNQKEEEKEKID